MRFGVKTVEIGIQTMNDARIEKFTTRTYRLGFHQGGASSFDTEYRMDRPDNAGTTGDTEETIIETAFRVADLSPNGVRIYPALVLSGTGMDRMYRRGEYNPLSLDHTVDIVKNMTMIFESRSIPIIRIGLCPSIELERRIVAGPYHPALGSLVYESRLLDTMISCGKTRREYR